MKNIWDVKVILPAFAYAMALLTSLHGSGQQLPKALILTGNGNEPVYNENYPPWKHEFQNAKVAEILKDVVQVDSTTDLNMLTPKNLKQYDLLISNSIFLTPNTEQFEALWQFVNNGKALLTLHCGILSFLNSPRYEELIGGIFIGGPSAEPATFRVNTENMEFWGYEYSFRNSNEHPVSTVVDDFNTKDELYYFQPNKKEFYVIARAENHPVMWWHPVGKGKVISLTLGHDEEAKSNAGYQQLLVNGVRWLTGIPLIHAANPKPVSNRSVVNNDILKLRAFTGSAGSPNITFRISANSAPELYEASCDDNGNVDLKLSGKPGSGKLTVTATTAKGLSATKELPVSVVNDGEGNIASYLGNTVTVSSNENRSALFAGSNLVDGDLATRWSSTAADSASVIIDLQKSYPVGKVILHWEASFAKQYLLQTSETGHTWKTLVHETNGDGSIDRLLFDAVPARYIRILATERAAGKWGYSLYEVEVFQ